ncbi:hypothetical protein [Chryseobacterium camelliae]|uniref:hypothetical protein n=1 Tax=Chryseobacterium camelliae TaxID=1265445 RepID=UPI00285BBEBF|nr:hypothetical protein [Chryseobacterium camelliae]MDR6514429.1 hypothetical protein [Chryseobacterium camelliae]
MITTIIGQYLKNPAILALIEAEILFEKKIAAESRKKLPELRIEKHKKEKISPQNIGLVAG